MILDELQKLINDMKVANEYAMQFSNTEDGGTCNFDTPMIKIKATEKWLKKHKLNCSQYRKRDNDGLRWFLILDATLEGQGNRRTEMAEAYARKLKDLGWKTSVYYQMD